MEALTPYEVSRAKAGEAHCGDMCAHWRDKDRLLLCVADGLGHGPEAAQAARAALEFVEEHRDRPLPELFDECDRAIGKTRGCALGIAIVDEVSDELTFAGIGNIEAVIATEAEKRLSSSPGILGTGFRHLYIQTLPFPPASLVIVHTDGISPKFHMSAFTQATKDDPQSLAEAILEDWDCETDDRGLIVYRRVGN